MAFRREILKEITQKKDNFSPLESQSPGMEHTDFYVLNNETHMVYFSCSFGFH